MIWNGLGGESLFEEQEMNLACGRLFPEIGQAESSQRRFGGALRLRSAPRSSKRQSSPFPHGPWPMAHDEASFGQEGSYSRSVLILDFEKSLPCIENELPRSWGDAGVKAKKERGAREIALRSSVALSSRKFILGVVSKILLFAT